MITETICQIDNYITESDTVSYLEFGNDFGKLI